MTLRTLAVVVLVAAAATAQSSVAELNLTLAQLEQTAQTTNLDLAKLRIEKWKGGGEARQQYQANADALSRNLSESLPQRIAELRSAPENLAASFKLYRNVDALYDVLSALTDVASGAAPQSDYNALVADVKNLEAVRRSLADRLEALATQRDLELARLRTGGKTAATSKSGAKKIVIDDTAPRTTRKKKTTTPQ
ncbi:MAG TPA: hypothetical protein VLA96_00285 [Terriglobales bacterium]|nr:hypothetical protein [Terriglobales bacterium]